MDPSVYNSIVARAHLRSIRMTTSHFDMKPEAPDLDPGRSVALPASRFSAMANRLQMVCVFT